jgi:hypothetical protein
MGWKPEALLFVTSDQHPSILAYFGISDASRDELVVFLQALHHEVIQ